MFEQIAIEQGRVPWAPAADAELVRTLHVYDMPLVGVISQGGSLHLFRCIEGHVDDNNLWSREGGGILASALVREPAQYATLLHAAREALRALSAEIDLKLAALG